MNLKTIFALHVLTNYKQVERYFTKRVKILPKIVVLIFDLGRASVPCAFSTMLNTDFHLHIPERLHIYYH